MGSTGSRFLPGGSGADAARAGAPGFLAGGRHRITKVAVRMRIPHRRRGERTPIHPATISPSTQSVSIAVNGGTASLFNATPSSPNCSAGSTGTTCTFAVNAPIGADTFTVVTYSSTAGGGTPLDSGTAVVNIVAGKANSPHVNLGPVVTSNADSGMGSLRYAVGSANPGDTIMFMLPGGSTVTLNSAITLSTSVNIAGPGVTTSIRMHHNHRGRHSNVTFSGVTLSGNNANQIFIINPGVTSTISGLIFTQGSATNFGQPGGAIYTAGNVTLTDDGFQDNTSTTYSSYVVRRPHARHAHGRPHHEGVDSAMRPDRLHPHCFIGHYAGAVYNHGFLTVSGSTFDSNVLQNNFYGGGCTYSYGGAIYNDEYGTLVSSGNTYSNNEAYEGGAVFNDGYYGSASFSNDLFTGNYTCEASTGCAVAGCTATGGCTSYYQGYGGAIYDSGGPGVNISNSTFTSNVAGGSAASATGDGGALDLEAGSPSITGSTFSNNLAGGGTSHCSSGFGGGIYEDASGAIEIDSDTFTNNAASGDWEGYGGAIYNDNDPDTGSSDTFTGNSASAPGSACTTHSSHTYAYGGAVYADYGASLSNTTFSNNSVTASQYPIGGAIYMDDPSVLTSVTVTGNSATSTGLNSSPGSAAEGGGIDTDDGLRLTNSTITGNSINGAGNGSIPVYIYGGGLSSDSSLATSGNTFSNNTATQTGTSTNAYIYGGGVYDGGAWSSIHDTFSSNTATAVGYVYGGGICAYTSSNSAAFNGATISGNTGSSSTKSVYGGGSYLYISSGHSAIMSSIVSGNTAGTTGQNGYGGGIYDDADSTFAGLTVTNNTATSGGGGLYTDTTDSIANSTISGNSVTAAGQYYGGGGVFSNGPTTTTNTTISNNSVAVASASDAGGGGFYNDYQSTVTGSTISGNTVTGTGAGSGGGGIFNYDNGTFMNDTITANTSALDGGGYDSYNNTYNPLFVNDTFFNNTATGAGGNIRNGYKMEMGNTIAAGGTAGGVANDIDNTGGTLTSDDYNLIQAAVVGNALAGTTTNNKLGVDPALLPLSNYGGPTFTIADQAASPGTAAIPWTSSSGGTCGNETGVMVDQRGFTRGAGNKCDIGAYEFGGVASAIKVRVPAVRGSSHHHKHMHHKGAPKPIVL
jgi:hypothetical protein